MSELLKIGDVASFFSKLGTGGAATTVASIAAPPTPVKKSGNELAIVLGIVVVGIVGYQIYLYYEKKSKEEMSK